MKTFKLLAMTAMMAVSTTASAQFSNTSGSSSNTDGLSHNTVYLEWNPSSFVPDKGSSQSFTGFSAVYGKTFDVSQGRFPLFVEVGAGLQYSFYSEEEAGMKEKFNMFSAKVPVNIGYSYQFPNSNISIDVYSGLTLRYNFSGKKKYEYSGNGEDADWSDYLDGMEDYLGGMGDYLDELLGEEYGELAGAGGNGKDELNVFDKDDMGGDDNTWKRFQIGWQAGANVRIKNKFLVGVSYGTDFSEISKKVNINTVTLKLGYCF